LLEGDFCVGVSKTAAMDPFDVDDVAMELLMMKMLVRVAAVLATLALV